MPLSRPTSVLFPRLNGILFLALATALVGGCKSTAPAPKSAMQISPQESANTDVRHDRTEYQSRFLATRKNTQPMLFLVGDSTVHNVKPPLVGWGDVVGNYFDTNKIRVENHALAGRSSRTFITQDWWQLVLNTAKPGDFIIIQLGHNDGGPIDDTTRARGSLPGIGDGQKEIYNPITKQQESVHTYGWYLRKYISGARDKGMTPIICSPVPHVPKQAVQAGDVEPSRYVEWSGEVATNENVAFINLNKIVMSHYAGMSPQEIKAKYFTVQDDTHFNAAGAELNAESVIAGVRELDCPLKNYLIEPKSTKAK
jgi:lysophospholipase L1-like esterase